MSRLYLANTSFFKFDSAWPGMPSTRKFSGLGFTPKVAIAYFHGRTPFFKSDTMGANTYYFDNRAGGLDRIISLDADGITFGDTDFLLLTTPLSEMAPRYTTVILLGGPAVFTGTYVGDGSDARSFSHLSGQPQMLCIAVEGSSYEASWRWEPMAGDLSLPGWDDALAADYIESFDANGFTIGTKNQVNANGQTFHYFGIYDDAGPFASGSFTGTGSTKSVTTGITPIWVLLKNEGAFRDLVGADRSDYREYDRINQTATSSARKYQNGNLGVGDFTGFAADGFTVGNGANGNQNGSEIYWCAFGASHLPDKAIVSASGAAAAVVDRRSDIRVTQVSVEAVMDSLANPLRITQVIAEVLITPPIGGGLFRVINRGIARGLYRGMP